MKYAKNTLMGKSMKPDGVKYLNKYHCYLKELCTFINK